MLIWINLRMIIQYLGASDCKLQEGSMRADVNLSVREVGAEEVRNPYRDEEPRIPLKQLHRAIEGETANDRLICWRLAKEVVQETRRWDDNKEYSYAMRSKEDAQDYRYFPEPDLVPIVISDEWLADASEHSQPELRDREAVSVIRKNLIFRNMMPRLLPICQETGRYF